jgi:hypothetical protein
LFGSTGLEVLRLQISQLLLEQGFFLCIDLGLFQLLQEKLVPCESGVGIT